MTEEQVKIYLSKYVLPQEHKPSENILRTIIFSLASVDWKQVEQLIYSKHPELCNGERLDQLDLVAR